MKNAHFTVAQFIEKLQSLPQNLPLLTSGYESGNENVQPPKIMKVTLKPENKYWDGEFQVADTDKTSTFDAAVLERVLRND